MDVVGADVGWEAASATESSEAEVRSLGEPGVDVNRKGSLGDQSSKRLLETRKRRGSVTEGNRGNAGTRIVPAERYGGGQRRAHGGVELHPERSERFGWVARTSGSSSCATRSARKRASRSMTSQPS